METSQATPLDPEHLRDVQYRDSRFLAARANLHVLYRTAPQLVFDWLATHVDWPSPGAVLDVGCGSGLLWEHVAAVAPAGVDLTLVDLSPGMVGEAVERATRTHRFESVRGETTDARLLPFDDRAFDVVTSTYVLYHVPEPAIAVGELARVVRDDGTVAVLTNGPGHIAEIEQIRVELFGPDAAIAENHTFSPALAASILVDAFDEVTWRRFDDTLRVTRVDHVVAFVTSMTPGLDATPEQVDAIRDAVERRMVDGVFTVSKHTGSFVCRAPKRPRG